ncbi:hypothetical protein BDZ91DRAFT_175674 [Kalaharituber pfeilii]|nr:hypothetical protein BDZ91DRAFT_175674 [Kalaharituber pfeilii]
MQARCELSAPLPVGGCAAILRIYSMYKRFGHRDLGWNGKVNDWSENSYCVIGHWFWMVSTSFYDVCWHHHFFSIVQNFFFPIFFLILFALCFGRFCMVLCLFTSHAPFYILSYTVPVASSSSIFSFLMVVFTDSLFQIVLVGRLTGFFYSFSFLFFFLSFFFFFSFIPFFPPFLYGLFFFLFFFFLEYWKAYIPWAG